MEDKISHTTRVNEVRVTDVESLRKAVINLAAKGVPVRLVENGNCRLWGQSKNFPYVVKVENTSGRNRFDVGFEKAKDGVGYVPVFDYHGDWIGDVLGQGFDIAKTQGDRVLANIGKLLQEYSVEALTAEAYRQGGMVEMQKQADDSYVMIVQ